MTSKVDREGVRGKIIVGRDICVIQKRGRFDEGKTNASWNAEVGKKS